jgi:hypothetical protein
VTGCDRCAPFIISEADMKRCLTGDGDPGMSGKVRAENKRRARDTQAIHSIPVINEGRILSEEQAAKLGFIGEEYRVLRGGAHSGPS